MRWLGWRTHLGRWWPTWDLWVVTHGLRGLERITQDSELTLTVLAAEYELSADRLEAIGGPENELVARIYRGVSDGLAHCAMDVYVSFK